jgi:hypothetical protein
VNGRLRLVLCGACVAIGVFHAPFSTHVLSQDMAGTYTNVVRAEHTPPFVARVAAARKRTGPEVNDVYSGNHFDARISPTRR